MESPRLGIFDINGTIHTDARGVPQEVRDGFRNLHNNNVVTTIATGRGLRRARELLGEDWSNIVSSGVPVSVENGGRLVTQDGRNLRYHQMGRTTAASALDVVHANLAEIKFVAYYPKEPDKEAVLWTPNGDATKARTEFITRHGEPGKSMNGSLPKLARRIVDDQACMLIVNFHTSGMEGVFTGTNMVVNGPELNVLEDGVSKGKGVEDIAGVLGVPLVDVVVAGNDYNDIPMFALPVGGKLLVGGTVTETIPGLIRLPTPEALGCYLQSEVEQTGVFIDHK